MSEPGAVERLRGVPLMAPMDDSALKLCAELATEFEVPAGHVLAEHGQPGSGMFLITEGTVVVQLPTGPVELGPGSSSAARAARGRGADRARARLEPVKGLAIGRKEFSELLDREPRVAIAMLPVLAQRLAGRVPLGLGPAAARRRHERCERPDRRARREDQGFAISTLAPSSIVTFGDATSPTKPPRPIVTFPAASTLWVPPCSNETFPRTIVGPQPPCRIVRSPPTSAGPQPPWVTNTFPWVATGPAAACRIETSRALTTPTSARSTLTSPAASTVFSTPCCACGWSMTSTSSRPS